MRPEEFKERIELGLLGRSRKVEPLKQFFETFFIFAKEFGWTYQDFINTPLPVIYGLQDELSNYYKRQSDAAKKRK